MLPNVEIATSFDTVLYGTVDRPAIIVVGVWDSLTEEHHELLTDMVESAHARNLAAVAVMLDPAPAQFLLNEPWTVFEPATTRIERMHRMGVDATVVVSFSKNHLGTSAFIFLESITKQIAVAELWLGAKQVFGRRHPGSLEAIHEAAGELGFKVRRMERETEVIRKGRQARIHLSAGRVLEAREVVGYFPIMTRTEEHTHRLAWAPGTYQVQWLTSLDVPLDAEQLVPLTLVEDSSGHSLFTWPDPQVPYIAFVRGPNDIDETAQIRIAGMESSLTIADLRGCDNTEQKKATHSLAALS